MIPVRKQAPIIVVGLGVQALLLMRIFSRMGRRVIAVGTRNYIGQLCRYGEKIVVLDSTGLIEALKELSEEYGRGTTCFISGGGDLAFLLERFPDIYSHFHVSSGPAETVNCFLTKDTSYRLAEARGIETGRWGLLYQFMNGEKDPDTELDYPVYLKWNRDMSRSHPARGKMWRLESSRALRDWFADADTVESKNLLVQSSFDEQGQAARVSFGGYFEGGQCNAEIVVRQVRESRAGLFSFLRQLTGKDAEIVSEAARRLIGGTEFSGFCEVEFFMEAETGRLVLIDVNPRLWGWCELLGKRYPSLGEIVCGLAKGSTYPAIPGSLTWTHFLRDIVVLGKGAVAERNPLRLISGLVDYSAEGTVACWDWRDIKPFFGGVLNAICGKSE